MATDTTQHNIFCDFLGALGVPHTPCYSSRRFDDMPFKSLFGMSKLLKEYGVESKGVKLDNPADIDKLSVPFIARTGAGFIIVTGVSGNTLAYMTQGVSETMPLNEFVGDWDGTAFLAFPDADAAEPDYAAHRRDIFIAHAKSFALWGGLVALFLYLFISNGLWRHLSTVLLALLDLGGLYLTWLLLQKSLKIHNPAADRVCRVLQEGGCDTVLETKASLFFRHLQLERGRLHLLLGQPARPAHLPAVDMLSRRMQHPLSAVHLLEHMVSEIPCPQLVHPLCERAGHPLVALLLLSRRRMDHRHLPAAHRVLRARRHLCRCADGTQPHPPPFRAIRPRHLTPTIPTSVI